uniref:TSA: Wollemia nobilis Ref_Wollemi_Transcript_28860_1939 transcribed RNA sequence n=1 Tax=Wollemia nobilis TaxID=56998 RepID=A0A0C9RG31_9CONI
MEHKVQQRERDKQRLRHRNSATAAFRGRQVTDGHGGDAEYGPSYYGRSKSTYENLRESTGQMALYPSQGKFGGYPESYPERPGEPDCSHYMRTGFCAYGINCRFNHPSSLKQVDENKSGLPECQFYLKTGTCKFGRSCKYLHPDRAGLVHSQLNELGFPMRMGEKECTYYMRTGTCKYGVGCKYDHPQPAALGSYPPVSGSSIYATAGSPLQSTGTHYSQSLSTWPLSRTPHVQGPCIQAPLPYMPVIYPSQQGILSAPMWGMYQGPAVPMTSPERQQMRGMGIMPGSTQQSHPSVGAAQGILSPFLQGSYTAIPRQFLVASNQKETYPERPGQPECQYYVKTGECKFGSGCRYHHPQGRVSESSACVLSPIGLPIRPTQRTCTYYNRFGICKFGPMCKFNHPMTGISYSPSSSSLSELPVVPYPRVSSPTTTLVQSPSSETLQETRKNRDQPVRELSGSKQNHGNVHSEDIAAAKASVSSDASVLSETT